MARSKNTEMWPSWWRFTRASVLLQNCQEAMKNKWVIASEKRLMFVQPDFQTDLWLLNWPLTSKLTFDFPTDFWLLNWLLNWLRISKLTSDFQTDVWLLNADVVSPRNDVYLLGLLLARCRWIQELPLYWKKSLLHSSTLVDGLTEALWCLCYSVNKLSVGWH